MFSLILLERPTVTLGMGDLPPPPGRHDFSEAKSLDWSDLILMALLPKDGIPVATMGRLEVSSAPYLTGETQPQASWG